MLSKKQKRWEKIRVCLRGQDKPLTTSEIFETISMQKDISLVRKTLQRDLMEMIEERIITQTSESPLRFHLIPVMKAKIEIEREEAMTLLKILSPDSRLYKKIEIAFGENV